MKTFKFLSGYSDYYGFDTVQFPIVNQIFDRTLGSDLVSVSPISPPAGQIYYSRPVNPNFYGTIGITNSFKFLSGYEN